MKFLPGCCFTMLVTLQAFGSVEIPLYLNEVQPLGGSSTKYTVGIYAGVAGGAPKLYQLDTGNNMFLPAYSNNLNEGVDQWWGNDFDTNDSVSGSETFGGRTVNFDTVNAGVALYHGPNSVTPLVSSNNRITVAQATSAYVEGNPSEMLPWESNAQAGDPVLLQVPDSDPAEYTYYGNFGAGLFGNDTYSSLYPVLGQLINTEGDELAGYTISFLTSTLTLYFDSDFSGGKNPVSDYDQVAQMTVLPDNYFPNTDNPASLEFGLLATGSSAGGESSEVPFTALLDSGGTSLYGLYDSAFQDIVSTVGTDVYQSDSGLPFSLSLAGPEGEEDAMLGFESGDTPQYDLVYYLDDGTTEFNLGWDFFLSYDVYFDAQNAQLRFRQVPEPATWSLIAGITLLALAVVRRRRAQA